jgi:hypothetical protein
MAKEENRPDMEGAGRRHWLVVLDSPATEENGTYAGE